MTFDLRQSIDPRQRRVRVNIESPLKGIVPNWVKSPTLRTAIELINRAINMRYARECVRDALRRGEAPYASHVFFDHAGVLDDSDPRDRQLGMECGDSWAQCADRHVFYVDRGMSAGMQRRWIQCHQEGRQVERRYLYAPKTGAANDANDPEIAA